MMPFQALIKLVDWDIRLKGIGEIGGISKIVNICRYVI